MKCTWLVHPYEWRSGTSDGLFLPIYPSRGMLCSTLLRGLINFCNKYMSSLWLMWVHGHTHTHPSTLLASIMTRNLRQYHAPIIYLPQDSHHTYLLWHFHSHSEIYCHATFHHSVYYDTLHHCHIAFAWSCSWHRICGKATFIILSYMSLLIHCISRYTAGGIHIESYFVLSIEL